MIILSERLFVGGWIGSAACEKNNISTVKKLTLKMLGTLDGILYLCIGLVKGLSRNTLTLNNFQIYRYGREKIYHM